MSQSNQLRPVSSFGKNEIRLLGDGGVREFEKTFVLAEVPAAKLDLSLQLASLLTPFASASTPKVGRTRCVCDSYDGDPVFDYPKNDQKWKPAQLQVTVTVIDGWKLLATGRDTSQGTVNFRIELQSDFRIPSGVVSQGLSEIGFSGRTELDRIHS